MTEIATRVEPAKIPSVLKEAVTDALLGQTYARVSGEGENGRIIYGAAPRQILKSGFLLPMRSPSGDDEVTSPTWISSLGLQLEVNSDVKDSINLKPRASTYLKVLPTVEEFEQLPLGSHLRIRSEVSTQFRERKKSLREALVNELGNKNHPDMKSRSQEIVEQAWADVGMPESLRRVLIEMEEAGGPTDSQEPHNEDEVWIPLKDHKQNDVQQEILTHHNLFETLRIPDKWIRLDFELPEFNIKLNQDINKLGACVDAANRVLQDSINEQLTSWKNSNTGRNWGYRTNSKLPITAALSWARTLDSIRAEQEPDALPELSLRWNIELAPNFLDVSRSSVKITLENSADYQKFVTDTDNTLFLVDFQIHIPHTILAPLKLDRVKPSYRYNKYLNYPAMGVNNGIQIVRSDDSHILLNTTWRPRYDQPRIEPTSPAGVVRNIRALSRPNGLDGLLPIVPAYIRWIETVKSNIDPSDGLDNVDVETREKEERAFNDDLSNWKRECNAIESGLKLLQESQDAWSCRGHQSDPKAYVFEAWLAMNEAMANFLANKLKTDKAEWRLFQIAFILASLPAIASRMTEWSDYYDEKRDDAVTLLYFATGGGKSEAFFGLLVFTLFFDRLRGKNLGISALVRYPLRLLTVQQAQRCAQVLAYAEEVKRQYSYGGHPLSIGFWVGSSGSPNRMNADGMQQIPNIRDKPASEDVEKKLLQTDYRYVRTAWRKLSNCPKCHTETVLRQYTGNSDKLLGHFCLNSKCMFNQDGVAPLPFYIVDENIYSRAPSVLLGTVDKLALIGHSGNTIRQILGMFGAAPWIDPIDDRLGMPKNPADFRRSPEDYKMKGVAPAYPNGKEIFKDPFPALIVQDEAHLLDESLGSFSGLFESTLESMFSELAIPLGKRVARTPDGKFRRAKVIAASATVSDPHRQLEHLYQRSIPATQFPAVGPSLYESFYYSPRPGGGAERAAFDNPEISSEWARIYMAFMTNGGPHTSVTTSILANFNLVITQNLRGLCSGDTNQVNRIKQQLEQHVCSNSLASIHRNAITNSDVNQLATLIDLHRVNLTYVTNKKGGDQLSAAQDQETRKLHDRENLSISNFDTRLISGAVDQGIIQKVIEDAQQRVPIGSTFREINDELRSVIATSAISHGVDVDEFNSMIFAGMPSGIDEYIQASSRVGRTHIGFVLLVPTPQQRRDRHIVHIFDSFHRFLERMVQPAAIDRYAEKAVSRVFPSLLQAYLLGVAPCVTMLSCQDKAKLEINFDLGRINSAARKGGKTYIDNIVNFFEKSIGIVDPYSPTDKNYYINMIETWIRDQLLDNWNNQTIQTESVESFFRSLPQTIHRPMMSLRDVDEMGTIWGFHLNKNSEENLLKAMDYIRGGTAITEEGEE